MPPKQNIAKKILWAILSLIVLAGIGTAGYFIYKKQISATETATFTSPTPPNSTKSNPPVSSRNDPNGPYYHQIFSASSADGTTWQKNETILFDHASVPGAAVKNNKIYLYFVDASGVEDQISVVTSTDQGKTFSEKQKVVVKNAPTTIMADPHPEIINNKIRLYYLSSIFDPQKQEPSDFTIYSAESVDGVNFENPKVAFKSDEMITDPDVFETEKDWRMFLSKGRDLILTISTDGGTTFKKDENFSWNKGSVCDTVKIGNAYYTFYCGEGGIKSAIGGENGELLAEEGIRLSSENGQIMCDPTVIKLPDNSYLMFYKTQKAK